jgi:hypothetical protein
VLLVLVDVGRQQLQKITNGFSWAAGGDRAASWPIQLVLHLHEKSWAAADCFNCRT